MQAPPNCHADILTAVEIFTLDTWAEAAVEEMLAYDLDQGAAGTA